MSRTCSGCVSGMHGCELAADCHSSGACDGVVFSNALVSACCAGKVEAGGGRTTSPFLPASLIARQPIPPAHPRVRTNELHSVIRHGTSAQVSTDLSSPL